jgi:hypothetical protein
MKKRTRTYRIEEDNCLNLEKHKKLGNCSSELINRLLRKYFKKFFKQQNDN